MAKRNIFFFACFGITMVFFLTPLRALVSLSLSNDAYSHILVMPLIGGYFLFQKRALLSQNKRYSFIPGGTFIFAGTLLWAFQKFTGIVGADYSLSVRICSFVLVLIGGSVLFYGTQLFKNARFPLLVLLLIIPLPGSAIDKIVLLYQAGTAFVVDSFFKVLGITYIREGYSFYLSTLSIHIAPECSGIRSSTALIITSMVAGQFFLRTFTGKCALVLISVPLAVLKNGIRVATLTLLGARVDMGFINGPLHHKGGFVFFLVALAFLISLMLLISKMEKLQAFAKSP